ncbi:MAG: response regulator [Dehalococcoidia bacterium]
MTADVLVVDDDPGIRMVLADMLELEGYTVRTASDGIEALERCEAQTPDLMILDLMMPRLDGMGVIGALTERGLRERFPVLVLTARHGGCAQLRGTVEDCAEKPFDIDEVLARIARLLPAAT